MKNFKFKWLLLSIILSIASINTAWAYWYAPGNFYSAISFNTDCSQMSSDNYLTYYCVPAGTYQFKLAVDKSGSKTWGFGALTNGTTSIITDLTTGSGSGNNSITVNTTCNIVFHMTDGSVDGTWACTVTAGAPTLPIKANFNNGGDWVWKTMQSNGDGTVSIKGLYGNISTYNFRRTSREVEASWDGQYVTTGVTAETGLSASDNAVFTYKASDGTVSIRKANTVTKTNYIYFDNENAGWSDTYLYFAIGHPEYSKMYRIQQITNTNLWYHEQSADSWSDGSYYAVAGGTSAWDGGTGWSMPNLMGWTHRSAPYTSKLNLESGYNYIVGKTNANNDEAITITKTGNTYSALNSLTVGYKYVVDGADMTSGGAPAQVTMNSYVFNAHGTVTGNSAQTINANASGTYSKSINAAYRGKVVLTQSNLSDGYKFIGWYDGNTQKETGNTYTYYPNANTTISAKYEYRWTLKGTFPNETAWANDHYISNFSVNASSQDVGYIDLTLPGNTSFQFKVVDRTNNAWHSCSGTTVGSEYNFTYVSSDGVAKDCNAKTGDEKNMVFNTAAPGTYRFTWNADTKTLTVTYPASYKVTYDGNDKTGGSVPTDNDYYAANATVTVKGNSGSLAKSGYNTLAYWNTEDDGSGTDKAISTGTFSITGNTTLYAKWTQGVTLHDNNGAAHNGSTTVNWKAAGPFSITAPTRDHYSVEGYYAEAGCTNKVLTAAGAIAASSVVDGSSVTFISGSKWAHASATTLYTKWTEDPYTVTTSAGTGGSVDEASYTAYIETTTAISATPAAGYKFDYWEVLSGTVTIADQYSASTTITATSGGSIKAHFVYRWSIAGSWLNYPKTENWDADTYAMGHIGKDVSSEDDTCYVEIPLPANTTYTFDVVDRSTSPYTFHKNGNDKIYYMTYGNSTNWGFGTTTGYNYDCGITTAGAGTYKFAYNITDGTVTVTYPNSYTVTFGYFGTGGSAVSATVEDAGAISSGGYATAGKDITFTKTATNLAYTFSGWYNASSDGDAISCMASDDVYDDIAANISVYAQFKTRYGLHGSLTDDGDPAGGMPGWEGDGADFTVEGFTAIGEGTGKGVDLECSRTLEPNKEYKFRVHDRAVGSRWGLISSAVLPAEAPGNNVKLSTYGDVSGKDVKIETVGYGTYVFHITNMYDNGDGKYYPAIQVDRPASSQLTLGRKHYTNGTLSEGNTGGTVTAATNEGSGFAITNSQFYANGSTLTFTASPATGYHVEGWYSNSDCSTAYTSGEGGATISGSGNVTLTLSSVSSNKTVYVKFTEDTNTFSAASGSNWSTVANWSAGHVPSIYEVVTITAPVVVDAAHAVAKRVILDQSSSYTGKLTVNANKGLEVTETIRVKNKSGDLVVTKPADLILESSASGNASLIFDNSTLQDSATVCLYSKGWTDGVANSGNWTWQYVGVPVTDATRMSDYYGGYMYEWQGAWVDKNTTEPLTPFTAYSVSYKTTSDKLHTYVIDGELALTGNRSIDIPAETNFMFVANSWTAPLYIKNIEFTNARATVYFLNSGQGKPTRTTTSARFAAGTYLPIPVNSSPYTEDSLIAPMQAFIVRNTGLLDGSMTINYGTVVRPEKSNQDIITGEMHAPQRFEEEMPNPVVLKMYVDGAEYGDRVILLEREDFTHGFDNGWDGEKLQVNATTIAPRLFAINETGGKEAISAKPELNGTVIGFRPGTDATYKISFEYNGSEPLYLRDTRTNQMASIDNLSEYMFSSDGANEDSRFIIVKSPAITTGISETGVDAIARKQIIDGVLYIIRDGQIYSTDGQIVK